MQMADIKSHYPHFADADIAIIHIGICIFTPSQWKTFVHLFLISAAV
jgi:hypothetical protein